MSRSQSSRLARLASIGFRSGRRQPARTHAMYCFGRESDVSKLGRSRPARQRVAVGSSADCTAASRGGCQAARPLMDRRRCRRCLSKAATISMPMLPWFVTRLGQMRPPVHRASRDRSRGEQSPCAGERRDRGVAEAIGGVELGEDERDSWQAATSASVRPLLVSQGGRSPSRRGAGRPSRDPGVCTAGSARVSERHLPRGADAAATSVRSRPTPMSAGSGPGA